MRLKNNYKHLDQEDNTLEKCKAEMRVNMEKDNVIQILDYYKNIDKEIKFNNVIIKALSLKARCFYCGGNYGKDEKSKQR